MISFARPSPTYAASSAASATEGIPTFTSGSPNWASSVATRRSQASASSNAAPRQYPLIIAAVGSGVVRTAARQSRTWPMTRWALAGPRPVNVPTWMPAENERVPAPANTRALTRSAGCVTSAVISPRSATVSAFNWAGRLNVIRRTSSETCDSTAGMVDPRTWHGVWSGRAARLDHHAVLARRQPEPAVGHSLVPHAEARGHALGRDVVQVGEGKHLIDPRLRGHGEDRACRLGGKPLALVARVQVPAHLHQAGGPVGVAERQKEEGPDGFVRLRSRGERDHGPHAERSLQPALAVLPAAEPIPRLRTPGQRPPGMRAEPARHVLE